MKQTKKTIRSGFTLAELMIVVAIIAVLVGISIPVFTKNLEKTREAYDIATMRQAAAAAIDLYYAGVTDATSAQAAGLKWWPGKTPSRDNAAGAYDPKGSRFYPVKDNVPAYGKGTAIDGGTKFSAYAADQDYTDAVVMVAIYPNADQPYAAVFWKNKTNNQYVGGQAKGGNAPQYCISINLN